MKTRKPLSEETKRKIGLANSIALKGRKLSKECLEKRSKTIMGHSVSIQTRKKISDKLKGNKNSSGYKHTITEETKEKIRRKMVGRKNPEHSKRMSGENSPRYIKDRTKLKKREDRRTSSANNDWVVQCKKRDGKRCKMRNKECKGQLEVHHILSYRDYPEKRYDINNGITLCHFHHPRGRVMEEKMVEYLKELINK